MNLVIVAHPDDEVVGVGAHLQMLRQALFVHITDGAPRDLRDAHAFGFHTRGAYAEARRRELQDALALAGIGQEQSVYLGVVDQEAAAHLAEIAKAISQIMREVRPDIVLTHSYEGGHPDHDAAAFGCHAARRLLVAERICPALIVEFASYHSRNGVRVCEEFLSDSGTLEICSTLTEEQRAFKQQLVSCFRTQAGVLAEFPLGVERFRIAPQYDFSKPPHEGRLHYENYPWSWDGKTWREAARRACEELFEDSCFKF